MHVTVIHTQKWISNICPSVMTPLFFGLKHWWVLSIVLEAHHGVKCKLQHLSSLILPTPAPKSVKLGVKHSRTPLIDFSSKVASTSQPVAHKSQHKRTPSPFIILQLTPSKALPIHHTSQH